MTFFGRTTLILCFLLSLSQLAAAATYTVTKSADTNDGMCDADCSLREAITAANGTADNDTIVFSNTFFTAPTTLTLANGEIIISNNGTLAITGPTGVAITINGNNASRVFLNNTSAVTTISNLTITGGNGVSTLNNGLGGAIRNTGGTLTLNNLLLTGNAATNGGALSNGGTATLTIINSTVSNNRATGSGGAVQNFSGTGNITNIINSTFSGNTSNSTAVGGGAMQANGVVNIANSTFSGNNAVGGDGGGIYYNGQSLTLNNVTIAFNTSTTGGGGLHKATATLNANIRNTIVSNNTGDSASPDIFGAFNSQGNNLIGTVGTSTGWIASDLLNRNPQLLPLGNNGGRTQTHAIPLNSPAINAGQNCVVTATCAVGNPPQQLTTDQRGASRLLFGNVDIGAYENNLVCDCTPAFASVADFDGDRRTDFSVFRPSNATWFLQRSASGAFAAQFGVSTDRLTPADFDGDGRTDIAVWRESGANPDRSFFYILNSSNNTVRIEQFGAVGDDPRVIGDWDGDGRADLAVFRRLIGIPENPPPATFYYRPSGSPNVNFRAIQWGLSNDRPVVGDYDGDGKLDPAVYRPLTRIWYILQSSSNTIRYVYWGLPTDQFVPADYDGDGKTDLAIFRNGLWAILQSSNNQQRYQIWGEPNDILVPGDYEGDGKTDLAVWRNGIYYVLRSSDNQSVIFPFGASSDIPVASALINP